jgi:predicted GIY-YIG superfamily endonuclease
MVRMVKTSKESQMSVPKSKEFLKPILTFMSDGELHKNKELREKVIEYFNLDETEINEKVKSGKITRVEDRVNWTIQYFRRSLLIQTISRGQYQVTPRGKKVFKEDIDILDEKYLNRFKEFRDFSIPKKSTKKTQPKETPSSPEEPKPTEPKKEVGFVYYIQEEMDGNIKIGFSDDPIKRLSQHQTSNPRELRMLVYVKGNKEDEKKIQKKFESLQTTGEWFKPDKRLLVHIEKEKSKFFEIVQNLSTDYEELRKRIENLEIKI